MTRSFRLTAALLLCTLATPAFAVNKDLIQLQTQIQQLQDAVARLQQSNDERMGVLKDLVQQSADSVNRMSVNVDALQRQLTAQQAAQGVKIDTVSSQVSSLNDSLDEIKARMNKLERALADVQGQQQSIGAALQNLPQTGSVSPSSGQQPPIDPPAGRALSANSGLPNAGTIPSPLPGRSTSPGTRKGIAPASVAPGVTPVAPVAAPVSDLYKAAYSDYMAARYAIASSEFGDVIKGYPDDNLSGNAFYYLGEIDYRAGKYSAAAKDYDKVLEQFPDSTKIPAAHLHKGQALIELKQQEAGVRELRALIQRFPASPEAAQARSKLNGMGVPIKPRV